MANKTVYSAKRLIESVMWVLIGIGCITAVLIVPGVDLGWQMVVVAINAVSIVINGLVAYLHLRLRKPSVFVGE